MDAVHAHAILSVGRDLDRREIRDHVRREVLFRIAHLVHELLRHAVHIDATAGARVLRDHERAILLHLDDREADVLEVRDGAPVVRAISAGRLRAALHDVSRDDPRRQSVPVIGGPPELVHQRREDQGCVGAAASDDDIRAARERLDDRRRADVRVGRQHAVAHRCERGAGLHVRHLVAGGDELVDAREEIVARHDAHAEFLVVRRAARHLEQGIGAAARIHAARVRDYAHAAVEHRREHALHLRDEVARVSGQRIALHLLLQDRHSHLGQIVEHEIVDRPALDLPARSFEPVTPEPLSSGDADDATHAFTLSCAGRLNAPRWGPRLCNEARSAKASTSRVSSGYTIASMNPRAPAKRASSCWS